MSKAAQMSEKCADRPPRLRKRVPLSLRIFATFTTILGIGSVMTGARIYRTRQMVAEIERLGGEVYTDSNLPAWVESRIGWKSATMLGEVFIVRFGPFGASDPALIDDAFLSRMRCLTRIKSIAMNSTNVTDTGLANLKSFSLLTGVSLVGTRITDAGIGHLVNVTTLRHVDLRRTAITDAGVAELSGIAQLKSLKLGLTQITDSSLRHIAKLKQLRKLDISSNAGITDARLQCLYEMPALERIDLLGTSVTAVGVAQLRAALPDTHILYVPDLACAVE